MRIYGYCRVSSKGQFDNNSLEQQEKEIRDRYDNAIVFQEVWTGTSTERPVFKSVIEELKENDMLVVTKLDRFCRTTKEGLEQIDQLMAKKIKVHILNMGLIEDSSVGRLILTNLLAFAEFERNMIIERTQSGKQFCKENNKDFKEGRPRKFTDDQIKHALELLEVHSYKEVEHLTRISKSTLIRAKRKLNIAKNTEKVKED